MTEEPAAEHVPVVVVGGGQAGLSTSCYLTEAGIHHRILEAKTLANEWRTARWDAFTLVTPTGSASCPATRTTVTTPTAS